MIGQPGAACNKQASNDGYPGSMKAQPFLV